MTSKAEALPKLRVTLLICTEELPQWSQRWSEDIGRDDDEFAGEADFDDSLGRLAVEGDAGDNDFAFAGLAWTKSIEQQEKCPMDALPKVGAGGTAKSWSVPYLL